MGDSRKHERAVVALWPRHRVATEVEYAESACIDLSPGGMFIESSAPPKPGTFVKVVCRGDCGVFRALGHVAWRRLGGAAGPTGMGIRFLKLSPGGSDVVEGLLASARLTAVARASVEEERTAKAFTLAALFVALLGAFSILIGAQ